MRNKVVVATVAVIITVIFSAIFVIGQQTIRLLANMPQIQVAQDTAQSLSSGTKPEVAIASNQKVNLATSSAGFVIIYGKTGKVIAGTGELDGEVPVIPYGVLQHIKPPGYNAVTWQPRPGVRIASVEVATDHYYVLAGRSLSEPEKLVNTITKLTFVGYIASLLSLLAGWFIYSKTKPA